MPSSSPPGSQRSHRSSASSSTSSIAGSRRGQRRRATRSRSSVERRSRRNTTRRRDEPDPLEQLVTYGALYRADGSLVADTRSFSNAPSLSQLGISVERSARDADCFDFKFRDSTLRGVVVEVKGAPEKQYILLAASRRDMDADAQQLLAVGWWVLVIAVPSSLVVGWWFGRRTTRGIEDLAASARRVASGELDVRFEPDRPRDEEVAALAAAMREMVGRLKTLLETERRFASHAAHELRSPLAVLRGELELALRRPRQGSEYETFLREALDDTKRLANLAENLLVVARSGARGSSPPTEPLDVRELIDEAIASSRARAPDAPSIEVDGDAACVQGVRGDLVRMVRNLVDNAVEHGVGAEPVRLRVTSKGAGGRHRHRERRPGHRRGRPRSDLRALPSRRRRARDLRCRARSRDRARGGGAARGRHHARLDREPDAFHRALADRPDERRAQVPSAETDIRRER